MFLEWLSRIWKGEGADKSSGLHVTVIERDENAELAELAALIESGDTSPETLERIAKLMGKSDPNEI